MPEAVGVLVSYCGLVCSFCPAYRLGSCRGCDAHVDECFFAKCASGRGLRCCFFCEEFPCRVHREGFEWETLEFGKLRWRVFSDVFLSIF